MDRSAITWEIFFGALVVGCAIPLWLVDYPPIQDLPQHLAAIRVLHSHGDAAFGMERFFDVDLLRTQYLAYYLVADLLAYPFGVELANRILITAAVCGTPYALAALLRALGRDARAAVLVLPLAYNAHLILGFLNFVAAIPLALAGLAVAVRLRREPQLRSAILLGVIALGTFYTHVVPFAFLGLGVASIALGADRRRLAHLLLPLAPSALAAFVWSRTSPAGQATLTAALLGDADAPGPRPDFASWPDNLREAPMWLTDVFHGEGDDRLLVAWALLMMVAFAIGAAAGGEARHRPPDPLSASLTRRVALLSPVAGLAYFVTPTGYDWIWPINARFPLLCSIFLIVAVPFPKRIPGAVVLASAALISLLTFVEVGRAFSGFAEEVGDLDEAIESIPEGSRVAGLIYDRGSREAKFSPFIHSVAYYQARRGGAVMFTFADFPQSPFRFREDDRPPRVGPRWEWMPERVDPARDLGWYQYVLVRGGPGRIAQQRSVYEPIHRSAHWSVWRRLDATPAEP